MKYEYRMFEIRFDTQGRPSLSVLNEKGKEGWQLVGMFDEEGFPRSLTKPNSPDGADWYEFDLNLAMRPTAFSTMRSSVNVIVQWADWRGNISTERDEFCLTAHRFLHNGASHPCHNMAAEHLRKFAIFARSVFEKHHGS